MDEVFIGVVDHFYPNINVAVIELIEPLTAGDSLHFISPETRSVKIDFVQKVVSMEIDHQQIEVGVDATLLELGNQKVHAVQRLLIKNARHSLVGI